MHRKCVEQDLKLYELHLCLIWLFPVTSTDGKSFMFMPLIVNSSAARNVKFWSKFLLSQYFS